MSAPSRWTTPADIEQRVRRHWVSGRLLRDHAEGTPFVPIEIPVRGPSSSELGDHLDAARQWAARIERASSAGAKFHIVETSVGGRHLGRSKLPGRAIVDSYQQAWRLLGVDGAAGEVARFDEALAAATRAPAARDWVMRHPLRAIELSAEWSAILAARDWLEWNRGSGKYLREIDAPGVDTKLVERRRSVLAAMFGVSGSAAGFIAELGLGAKPSYVRMRFDPALLGMPPRVTEGTFRVDELTVLAAELEQALIVENEISFLSVPVPRGGVVLWGKGFEASAAASVGWLADAALVGRVRYWGDIDTHGFAILHRVRAHLPGVRSVLMDRATLLRHEARWGSEPSPSTAHLAHLDEPERALFDDLVSDIYGARLRLEQERIDWDWVLRSVWA